MGTREFGIRSSGRKHWEILVTLPGLPVTAPVMLPLSSSFRQLDKNQISCIEDGAFRALRGLEVL